MTTEYDAEFEPISKSESGKNAYYLDDCKIVDHRPSYASCLSKVRDFKERQRTKLGCDNCFSAMGKGTCTALTMRKEEEIEGRALFYVDRTALQEQTAQLEEAAHERSLFQPPPRNTMRRSHTPQPGQEAPNRTYTSAKPTPAAAKPVDLVHMGGDYAAAINLAMKSASIEPTITPPEPIVTTTAPSIAKAGMSMIEIARAAMAQKSL